MTVKEYFEEYWFWFYNSDEEKVHGYDMPIVKCKDGTLLVCSVILKEERHIGCEDWLDTGSFFYCLVSSIIDLDDNIYHYIPDLGDSVDINKLEEVVNEHGGIIVSFEVLKYSFMEKFFNSFTMTAQLGNIVCRDLVDLKNKYENEICWCW